MKPRLALTLVALALPAGCGGGGEETLTVYLKQRLGPEGPHGQIAPVLAPVDREPRSGVAAAYQAVLELRVGPSPDERARGILRTLGPETRLRSVAIEDETAMVELAGREPDVYGAGAIVYSLTALAGIERVSLRLDGSPCCVRRHDGSAITFLSRDAFDGWQGQPCGERDGPGKVACGG